MFDKMMRGKETAAVGERSVEPAVAPAAQATTRVRNAAVIGPSIQINGDLRGEEDLIIQGEVHGTIQLKDNSLTVGNEGKVFANVYAHSITVEGKVEGDLYGSERVAIKRSGEVRGNILSPRVSLEDGGRFKGMIEMDEEQVRKAFGQPPASAEATPSGRLPKAELVKPKPAGEETKKAADA